MSYAVAATGGVAVYYLWRGGRLRSQRSMRHVLDDSDAARRAARRSFAHYAIYLVDFLRFTSVTPEEVRSRVQFDEWAAVEAERRGNGIVFITMHFGNWDLGAAAVADHGIPICVVADTFRNARLNELVLGARRHLGMEIIPADRPGPSVLRALRQNNLVAMLIDVPPLGGSVDVEFFGSAVRIADGPARIALRAGASVVAVTLPRMGTWSDRVVPEYAAVPFTPCGDPERDVRGLTQAIMHVLEGMIRHHPDQWYIFRNLWPVESAAPA